MTTKYAEVRAQINAMYPRLANLSDEEVDKVIRACGKEAAEAVKNVALAYLIIAGVAFIVCGGYYTQTRSWSFLVLGSLAFVLATLRARAEWKNEVRSRLAKSYGAESPGGSGGGGASAA